MECTQIFQQVEDPVTIKMDLEQEALSKFPFLRVTSMLMNLCGSILLQGISQNGKYTHFIQMGSFMEYSVLLEHTCFIYPANLVLLELLARLVHYHVNLVLKLLTIS